jgi:hypothetical protein
MTEQVKLTLPEYVNFTDERLDGARVTVEYDSNFNGRGETVTAVGVAKIVGKGDYFTDTALVVDGKHVGPNGHVFGSDDRHIGTDATVTATISRDDAIDMVVANQSYDVDDPGAGEIIVQTWDEGVMEEQGFMAGTDEIRMERV